MKKTLLWVFAAVVPCLMVVAAPARAQAPGLTPEVEEARKPADFPVGPGLWRFSDVAPDLDGTEDLAPLRPLPASPGMRGLGFSLKRLVPLAKLPMD